MAVRVLIVDDDAAFREVAAGLLAERGYRIIGEAGSAEAARVATVDHAPDAALIDVNLPDGDGISLAAELCRRAPGLRALLTSSDANAVPAAQLLACGAIGFVPKTRLAVEDLARYLDT